MFFAGVDLVSKFTSHFTTAESRIELARLSLEAGKIAEMKSAFIPATQYLKTGISMLDPTDRWTKNYELCLDLHTKAAEVGRTYGDCHATLCLVEETISHARSFKDKIKLLYVKMFVLAGQQKLVEAYKVCLGVLKELGVRMPSNPKTIHVLIEYAHTKRLLKGRKPRDLMLSLPQLSDELHIISLLFLDAAGMISWSADLEEHTSMVFLRMMRLTLKHGLCKYSSFAFATYGMVLAALGDRNTGYEFGRVALELNATQDGARGCISSTTVVVQSFLTHLKQPLYNSLAPMMEGHQIGMQTGEIEFAALCLSGHGGILVALGTNLESLEKSFLNYGTLMLFTSCPMHMFASSTLSLLPLKLRFFANTVKGWLMAFRLLGFSSR
jgi:predicted ATPase